ncbi:BTB domain-containing protein [Favolaschia claudopus]|uniref:BTB domain-containing protein n=1 Tax=Favolaschia claudopus TaxID=2862362 RepID=A0AAW0DN22_9AGAR
MDLHLVWQPIPYIPVTLFGLFLVSALALDPGKQYHLRPLLFLPILWLTYRLIYDGEAGIGSTFWFAWLARASELMLLTKNVPNRLSPATTTGQSTDKEAPAKNIEAFSLSTRIENACLIAFNCRGIGEPNEPPSLRSRRIPRRGPYTKSKSKSKSPNGTCTKSQFILTQLTRLLSSVLIIDLWNLHGRRNPGLHLKLGLAAAGWYWRAVGILMFAAGIASVLQGMHCVISIFCIFLGIGGSADIEEWPLLFSLRWENVRTLRAFWGQGWHHLLRLPLNAHAKFICQTILRLPADRSPLSSITYFFLVFALSGLVHYLGECVSLGFGFGFGFGQQKESESSGALLFFSLQALGIALEYVVLEATGLLKPTSSRWYRLLGNVLSVGYVIGWFALTGPIWVDPLIKAGALEMNLEWSFVMWLWTGQVALPQRLGGGGIE